MNNPANIMNNSILFVDPDRLRHNIREISRNLSGGTALVPVLKGDAFGLGLVPVAQILAQLPEVHSFAVAHAMEGLALRQAGITHDILVMDNLLPSQISAAVANHLTVTVGRAGMLTELAQECAVRNCRASVQLKIDTGLHRIGLAPGAELDKLITELKTVGGAIDVQGAFTHFSDAENPEKCEAQYQLYLKGIAQLEAAGISVPMKHVCGSAASEYYPQYHLDAVRVGRRLYMDHPTHPLGGILEVPTWRTCVTNVRCRPAGEPLGYGDGIRLDHDALVATIGIGYGDGLNQDLVAAHGPVLVGGKRCALLACCMDQSLVDVTGTDCAVGDTVTLFGSDEAGNFLSSQEVSLLIGDGEGCGLTAALMPRVARVYEPAPVNKG